MKKIIELSCRYGVEPHEWVDIVEKINRFVLVGDYESVTARISTEYSSEQENAALLDTIAHLTAENAAKDTEIRKLRTALGYYAHKNNWRYGDDGRLSVWWLYSKSGPETAEEALK